MESLDKIILNFQIFYQKIHDINISKQMPDEKWTNIATHIHENNNIIVAVFNVIKSADDRKQISLEYQTDAEQLYDLIEQEADYIVKASYIITSLHQIVYELLSSEGNHDFSLDGKEEMAVLKKDIMYYICVSTKNQQNIYFHAFILLYALESLFNRHFYVGIDFEYTNKKIQLAQLNFEHKEDLRSMIMIVSPNELEAVMMDNFINLIICNKYIKKILHGSDSLDIPYMYEHMLDNDPNKIIRFTRTLIDTRFLCEYYKLNKEGVSEHKCSIYDEDKTNSAIYYFGVVNEEQQGRLTELMQSLPPVHDIVWNVHRLNESQKLYSIYDVIYLKYFYYRMIYVATLDESTDLGKKNIIELYKHVLAEMTQLVYIERRNVTMLMQKCKTEVDPVNNYMIRKPGGIYKLIDIFNMVSTDLNTVTPKASIDKIIKVNYYKGLITTILKRMVYGIITRKCRVYKDKNTIWTDKLDNQFIFDFLNKMNFYHIEKMFKEIDSILDTRISNICQS